jgi:uncharacterized protein
MTEDFTVRNAAGEGIDVSARLYEPDGKAERCLILAHGAGAGHDSTFMVAYAAAIAERGVAVVTFNFPYTERGRRPPDSRGVLEACWRSVIDAVRSRAGSRAPLVAGGKSMGGRIASQVAAEPATAAQLAGLVFLGYPLHPPGRPDQRRTAHWPDVRLPALFVQGARDSFATRDELRADLPAFAGRATLLTIEGGDHSFKVTRSAGRSQDAVHAGIQDTIVEWISRLP